MALDNPRIKADVIEVQEFPILAQKYDIRAVPKTVINEIIQFTGAVAEQEFLSSILRAVGKEGLLAQALEEKR